LKDTASAWKLLPDGTYERVMPEGKKHAVRSQQVFYKQACENNRLSRRSQRTVFEPHRPPAEHD
jgi:polyphosphate kinase